MLPEASEQRQRLLRWAQAGLAAVEPAAAVRAALRRHRPGRAAVLAIGKAAAAMARGAADALGEDLLDGVIVAPSGATSVPGWRLLVGDHPLPGPRSLAAGKAVFEWLRGLRRDLPLVVLISGGGSALLEKPVAGLAPGELAAVNRWLLASGLDIGAVNNVRARFSQLKRGGLLRVAGTRRVIGLIVSDVPGDRAVDVASGPLSPEPVEWPTGLPAWLADLHARLPLPDATPPRAQAELEVIASNRVALGAVAAALASDGFRVVHRGTLDGDAAGNGHAIARRILDGPSGVHLFGGETTVRLPASPGRGGRNQHLALAAALELAGRDGLLLALGTDGIDGNTEDAGALVDGGTVQRIHDAGFDADDSLRRADSNTALVAAGDVVHTGPTGTNVADIVIGWKP